MTAHAYSTAPTHARRVVAGLLSVDERARLTVEHLNVWYGDNHALRDVSFKAPDRRIFALVGPSGSGKSTLLSALNRTAELNGAVKLIGQINLDGTNILNRRIEPEGLRRRIGLVAQHPVPLPRSIFENVAYGVRLNGLAHEKADVEGIVIQSLVSVALWDEVKDRLNDSPRRLSGGQLQRLCLARALALNSEVLLLDEPCSSIDPIATEQIEDLILALSRERTIIIVTHNLEQAARLSDYCGFILNGRMVEWGDTVDVFQTPESALTADFLDGRYG